MHLENFTQAPQKIKLFLIDTEYLLLLIEVKKNDQGFIYRIKESDKKINGRFLRQELYALSNQRVE